MANPVRQTSTQRFGCILGATSNRDILTGRKPDGIHGVLPLGELREMTFMVGFVKKTL